MGRLGVQISLVLVLGLVGLPGDAGAEPVVISNGLAPPNPENVIDDGTYQNDVVYVRSVGCPPGWPASGNAWDDCPSPGGSTEVEVTGGGLLEHLWVCDSSTATIDIEGEPLDSVVLALDSSIIMMDRGTLGQLLAWDSSTFTMNGGTVTFLGAYGSSSVAIIGGTVGVYLYDSSTVTMAGGTAAGDLFGYDSSTFTMNGGALEEHLHASGSFTFTMTWGTIGGGLYASECSTVTMAGGTVERVVSAYPSCGGELYRDDCCAVTKTDYSTVTIRGGTLGAGLYALGPSTIVIEGENFAVDTGEGPVAVPYGDLSAVTGTLTGTLRSGDLIDNVFERRQDGFWGYGTITLVEYVPEPIQTLLHSFALLTLVLLRRARRRSPVGSLDTHRCPPCNRSSYSP